MSEQTEAQSKDRFFAQVGEIADAMVAAHGKEFAMGTLVLAARWIAEGRDFSPRPHDQDVPPDASRDASQGAP